MRIFDKNRQHKNTDFKLILKLLNLSLFNRAIQLIFFNLYYISLLLPNSNSHIFQSPLINKRISIKSFWMKNEGWGILIQRYLNM